MNETQTFLLDIGLYRSLSFALVAIWVSLYPISWIYWGAWGWLHDNKEQKCHNRVAEWLTTIIWREDRSKYRYNVEYSFFAGFCVNLTLLALFPLTLYLYEITLFIVTVVALMHLTRFSIRHGKLFDKHVKDKEAHK